MHSIQRLIIHRWEGINVAEVERGNPGGGGGGLTDGSFSRFDAVGGNQYALWCTKCSIREERARRAETKGGIC